jgi:hypothetical protein
MINIAPPITITNPITTSAFVTGFNDFIEYNLPIQECFKPPFHHNIPVQDIVHRKTSMIL